MRYLPLTEQERKKILDLCGVQNFDSLVSSIPEELRLKKLLDVEPALHERGLVEFLSSLAKKNKGAEMLSFLGQGIYDHDWPVVIDQLSNRGEFLTAYTPYQPEISQGTLQSIFEFQSMIAELTGMEVANASLYDGSTALLEAILMSARLKGLRSGKVYVSEGVFEETLKVVKTYLAPLGFEVEIWHCDSKSFLSSADTLNSPNNSEVAAVVLQSPNRWGLIENWAELAKAATKLNCKSIAHVSHPLSLALFSAPGEHDVDIVSGEGQALGLAPGFGGPLLGLMAAKKAHVRQMPGRIVGATVDAKGQQAFCVTLATREQHIRREKATSNICSNQNLMALRATMYMSLMGPRGLEKKAELCRAKAYHAKKLLQKSLAKSHSEVKILEGECFNEITLLIPQKALLWKEQVLKEAEKHGILAGLSVEVPPASGFVSGLALAFTENHSLDNLQQLAKVFASEQLL